ncbi:MAG: Archaeal ATPase [Methanosaeta sp. PtaB.Bin087]|jgi:Cdc6-like AAA superfamily ATPase|nr:MAG: Archaeal ATPase [Methanosaeta sp. PtaB.Bin087]OPY56658.1 MAG: Archaeal ATPase [Methanosaeta sp. PtaU1.Bin055]
MTLDSFGFEREEKIRSSNVRNIFTPNKPINDIEFLAGRTNELARLVQQFNTPGQHSLLYGERGVGKSSLANVFYVLMRIKYVGQMHFWKVSCDSSTTFEDILREPLKQFGVDITIQQVDSTDTKGAAARAKAKFSSILAGASAEGELNAKKETLVVREGPSKHVNPSFAARTLGSHPALLIIDEADRLAYSIDKQRLAEFIKQLSDTDSKFKVLIVGVAEIGGELIENHESISRCLGEIKLDRMTNDELKLIIINGAEELRLYFDEKLINKIVQLSGRYPHFTHLLALKCAENAVAEGYTRIGMDHLAMAIRSAVNEYEGALKRTYDRAVLSFSTDMYRVILVSAACLDKTEFSAEDLRNEIQKQIGSPILQQSLNNYLKKLVSANDSTIFRRVAKGIYRFNDPRMPSYIKIANEI